MSTSRVPAHIRTTRKQPDMSTPMASIAACQIPAETPATRVRCDWPA